VESGARLTLNEVAGKLGCSESNVRKLIAEAHFPPGFLVGQTHYWWTADVDCYQWLATRGAFDTCHHKPRERPQRSRQKPAEGGQSGET
jgi:predicted DNA-binding transcriptional regulator AlpA